VRDVANLIKERKEINLPRKKSHVPSAELLRLYTKQ
jgi:hypothetical protein